MHSSRKSQSKKRVVAKSPEPDSCTSIFSADVSPSPNTSDPKYEKDGSDTGSLSSNSQMVSVVWTDDEQTVPRRSSRLQIELENCTENNNNKKTTANNKRSYSPFHAAGKTPLDRLDRKKYPLASKSPPPSILNFLTETVHKINSNENGVLSEEKTAFSRLHSHRSPNRTRATQAHKVESGKSKNLKSNDRMLLENKRQPSPKLKSLSLKKEIGLKEPQQIPISDSTTETCHRRLHRNRRFGSELRENLPFPVTPETSKLRLSIPNASASAGTLDKMKISNSDLGSMGSCGPLTSQSLSSQETYPNAVATPPIAESDLEPFAADGSNTDHYPAYSAPNIWESQKTSLPSPGLSPIYSPDETDFSFDDKTIPNDSQFRLGNSQESLNNTELNEIAVSLGSHKLISKLSEPTLLDMQSIIDTFESMTTEMKSLVMFQLLRRCSRRTLHVIAGVVNPALKCDFLAQLPLELSLHVLSFLNHRDLCRSAQVSKQWNNIIDSNETGWKEIFDRDGYILPQGELEKAIIQGWGWQDPYGSDGFEQDLSVLAQISSSETSGDQGHEIHAPISSRKGRSITKRKRSTVGSERSKRRAVGNRFSEKAKGIMSRCFHAGNFYKSEGPLTAANAAILAVPDPKLGLPALRKLHLFKSLYRRHYMLQSSWMNGKVRPHHFAFHAHASHVITCLQFDDDKIITGSDDTLINVYNTKTGALRKKLQGHEGGVWALQYEGNVLVSGSTDRSVRVWDIEKGLCTQVFHGHTSTVRCLQILMPEAAGKNDKGQPIMLPAKPLIITGSRDSQLRVWRLPEQGSKRYIQTGPPANDSDCPYFIRILSGHAHSVRAISAHHDTLVSGSYDNTVRVWKISTGETLQRLTGHTMKVYSVVLDHKRDRCISGSMDNLVKIWSIETGACLFTLEGHSSLVGLLDLQDERLVSAAADSTLRIWDPENGQCKSTLSAHTGAITCFQHDGQKVISGSDRTLKLWNIKTGECVRDLLIDLSGVWQVKFDERRCVAAVQRDNLTFVEVLDFGASRDGIPAYQCGSRKLLTDPSDQVILVDENEDV